MSWKASGVVWESAVKGSTKLFLLALADQANDEGLTVHRDTSQAAIAKRCSMSIRQIQRKIKECSPALLTVLPRPPGSHLHDHYQLNLTAIAATQQSEATKCRVESEPGDKMAGSQATSVSPRDTTQMSCPSNTTSNLKEKSAPPARPASPGERRAIASPRYANAAAERVAQSLHSRCVAAGLDIPPGMSATVYQIAIDKYEAENKEVLQ